MPEQEINNALAAFGVDEVNPLDEATKTFLGERGEDTDTLDEADRIFLTPDPQVTRPGRVRYALDRLYETESRAAAEKGIDHEKVKQAVVDITIENGAGDPHTYYRLFNQLSHDIPEVADWWGRIKDQPAFFDRIKEDAAGKFLQWENAIGARDVDGSIEVTPDIHVPVRKAKMAIKSAFMLGSILKHADIIGPQRFTIGAALIRDLSKRQLDRIVEQPETPQSAQLKSDWQTISRMPDDQLYDAIRAAHLSQSEDIRTPTEKINAVDFDQKMAFTYRGMTIDSVEHIKPVARMLGAEWSKLLTEGYREASGKFLLAKLGLVQTGDEREFAPGTLLQGLNVIELAPVGAFQVVSQAITENQKLTAKTVETTIEREFKFLNPTIEELIDKYGREGGRRVMKARLPLYHAAFSEAIARQISSPPLEGPLTPFEKTTIPRLFYTPGAREAAQLAGSFVESLFTVPTNWAKDVSRTLVENYPSVREHVQMQTFLRTGDIQLTEAVNDPIDAATTIFRAAIDRGYKIPRQYDNIISVLQNSPEFKGANPAEVKALLNAQTGEYINEARKEFAEWLFPRGYEGQEKRQERLQQWMTGERSGTISAIFDAAGINAFLGWTTIGELLHSTVEDAGSAFGMAVGGIAFTKAGPPAWAAWSRNTWNKVFSIQRTQGVLRNLFTNHPELAGKFRRFATTTIDDLTKTGAGPYSQETLRAFNDLAAQAATLDKSFKKLKRPDFAQADLLAGSVSRLWTQLGERFSDQGFNFADLTKETGLIDRLRIIGERLTKTVGKPLRATKLLLTNEAYSTSADTIGKLAGGEALAKETATKIDSLGPNPTLQEQLDVVPERVQNLAGLIASGEGQVPFWSKHFSYARMRGWLGRAFETKQLVQSAEGITSDLLTMAKGIVTAQRLGEIVNGRYGPVLDLIESKINHRMNSLKYEHSAITNNVRYDADIPALRNEWMKAADDVALKLKAEEESIRTLGIFRDRLSRHDWTKPFDPGEEFVNLRKDLNTNDIKYLLDFHADLFPISKQNIFRQVAVKSNAKDIQNLTSRTKVLEDKIAKLFERQENIKRDVPHHDLERKGLERLATEFHVMLSIPPETHVLLEKPFSAKAFSSFVKYLPGALSKYYKRALTHLPAEFIDKTGSLRGVLNRIDQYIKMASDPEGFRKPDKHLTSNEVVQHFSKLLAAKERVFGTISVPAILERQTPIGTALNKLTDISAIYRTDRAHPRLITQLDAIRNHINIIDANTRLGNRDLPQLSKLRGQIELNKTALRETLDKLTFKRERPSTIEIQDPILTQTFFNFFKHDGLSPLTRELREFATQEQRAMAARGFQGQVSAFNPFFHYFAPQHLKSADMINLARGYEYGQAAILAKLNGIASDLNKMSIENSEVAGAIQRGGKVPVELATKYPWLQSALESPSIRQEVQNYLNREGDLWTAVFDIAEQQGFVAPQFRKLFEANDYDPGMYRALERPRMIREESILRLMNDGRTFTRKSELAERIQGETMMMRRDVDNWRLLVDEGDRVNNKAFKTIDELRSYVTNQYGPSTSEKITGDGASGTTPFGDTFHVKSPLGREFLKKNSAIIGETTEKRLVAMESFIKDVNIHAALNASSVYGGNIIEPAAFERLAQQYGDEIRGSYVLVPDVPRSYGNWSGKYVHRHLLGEFNRATRSYPQIRALMGGLREAWLESGARLPDDIFKGMSKAGKFFDALNVMGRVTHILLSPRVYVGGIMYNFFNTYMIDGYPGRLPFLNRLRQAIFTPGKFRNDPHITEMMQRGILTDNYFDPLHDPIKQIQKRIYGLDIKDLPHIKQTLEKQRILREQLAIVDPTSIDYRRIMRDTIALESVIKDAEAGWLKRIGRNLGGVFLGKTDILGEPRTRFQSLLKFLYGQTDNAFKIAWWKQLRDTKSPEEAEWTIKTFSQNYRELPTALQAIPSPIKSMVVAFPYELARVTANNFLYRPQRMVAYMAMIGSYNLMQMIRGGVDWDRFSATMYAKGQKSQFEQIARFFTSSFQFNSRGEMVNHYDWLNWAPMFNVMQQRGMAVSLYDNVYPEEKRSELASIAGMGIGFLNQFVGQTPFWNSVGTLTTGRDPLTGRPLAGRQTHFMDRMRIFADSLGKSFVPGYSTITGFTQSLDAPVDPRTGRLYHRRGAGSTLIRGISGLGVEGTSAAQVETGIDNVLATVGIDTPKLRRGRELVVTDDDIAVNIMYHVADASDDNAIDSAIYSRRATIAELYFKTEDDSITKEQREEARRDLDKRLEADSIMIRGEKVTTSLTDRQKRQLIKELSESNTLHIFSRLSIDEQVVALTLMDRAGLSDDRMASFIAATVFTERGRYQREEDSEKVQRAVDTLRNYKKIEQNARLDGLLFDLQRRILPRSNNSERREENKERKAIGKPTGLQRRTERVLERIK